MADQSYTWKSSGCGLCDYEATTSFRRHRKVIELAKKTEGNCRRHARFEGNKYVF